MNTVNPRKTGLRIVLLATALAALASPAFALTADEVNAASFIDR